MRPWMGAVAAAAAIAVLPASALADDGQSVIEFKLPNKAAARAADQARASTSATVSTSRSRATSRRRSSSPPSRRRSSRRWAIPRSARSRRRPTSTRCAPSARRRSTPRPPPRPRSNSAAASKSKSAAAGTVRAQHADYWEDAGGRWLSIEGTTTQADGAPRQRTLHRPAARRVLVRRRRQQLGSRQPARAYLDTDVTPVAPYLYHVTALPPRRRGDRRHADAGVHPHRGAQRRRRARSPSRSGSATAPRSTPPGFHAGLHHPLRRPAGGLREDHDLAARVPEHRARSTTCRTRRRATSARRRPCSASPRPTRARRRRPATADQAARRRPDLQGLGPGGRQRHHRPDRQPRRRTTRR